MKNILAENMLRFRSKNIAAQEAAAIRKLIEQQTSDTVKYKNPADIEGFFNKTVNKAMLLDPSDVATVIFATTLKPNTRVFGAKSGTTYCIKLSDKYFVAVGQIGIVDNNVNPVVNDSKAGAIYFSAFPAGTTNAGANVSSNPKLSQIGAAPVFIPYGNNLAKFANDIVRATGVRTNRVGAFSGFGGSEKQIAAVLKASANLGITGAEKLVPDTPEYAAWKTATVKLLNA